MWRAIHYVGTHYAKAQLVAEIVIEEEEQQAEGEDESGASGEEKEAYGEAEGRVDEEERIPRLFQQMERKDEEVVLVDKEVDDSDEEGIPVPVKWSQARFGEYSVADA
jgi:hypothetical protein